MKIGKKQIILFVLAASLLIVGYKYTEISNLITGGSGGSAAGNTNNAGTKTNSSANANVNAKTNAGINAIAGVNTAGSGANAGTGVNSGNTADTAGAAAQADLYFSKQRLDRDTLMSKNKEAYQLITQDNNAGPDVKSQAYEKIMTLTEIASSETEIEGLIREKGFNDAFVDISEQGEADILINAPSLNEQQVAQIADIAVRRSKLNYENIHVRNVA